MPTDTTWTNWCGLTSVRPRDTFTPSTAGELSAAVREAAATGRRMKMPGAGHSFTSIAAADDILVRSQGLQGVTEVDRDSLTVTCKAGTHLRDFNTALERLGLSLHNMGDIDKQTLAGATSTGTHGTGGLAAGLAVQLAGLEIVTGTGEILKCTATENSDVFAVARVGLGALGILTSLTFAVEPLFTLAAEEKPASWDEVLADFDELAASNHYFEFFYWPHTDHCQVKLNNRSVDPAQPLSRFSRWREDELMSNKLFAGLIKVGQAAPRSIRTINNVAGKALSARSYSDVPWKVFTSPRSVRFREMEYAVPREHGLDALREARRLIDSSEWNIAFPIEVRYAPGDDIALSTASGRDTVYLAFHVPMTVDHRSYFGGVESIMREFEGRPHWGKLHSRTAADLAPVYPRWDEFITMRERLDPQRVFANEYLTRVLGA